MREFIRSSIGLPSSKYNELFTYLTALTCVILFFTHPDFRQFLAQILKGVWGNGHIDDIIGFVVLGLIAILGFSLSLFHVFTIREKSSIEKYFMGAFAIGATLADIEAGVEEINSVRSLLVLFPIWNIVMGIVMLIQIRFGKFTVTDENASLLEVWVIPSPCSSYLLSSMSVSCHMGYGIFYLLILFFINHVLDSTYFQSSIYGHIQSKSNVDLPNNLDPII